MKATETSVLSFIGGLDKAFIIPPFQRNYEWKENDCNVLFSDIEKACLTKQKHYLGNVVYYPGKNDGAAYSEYILVDGQQRVTSILLLLCALRDSMSDDKERRRINDRYLCNDTNNERYRVRLKQTEYDAGSFIKAVDGEYASDIPNPDIDSNVYKNYKLFRKLIAEAQVHNSKVTPRALYEAVNSVEIVDVNLQIQDNLEAVQTVFEKINSTGKPLAPADLIRNLLLLTSSARHQEQLYMKYWVKIEETLKSDNISRFAHDFYVMNKYEELKSDDTYSKFKLFFYEKYRDDDDIHDNESILRDLLRYAKYYAWIIFENCPDETLKRSIKMLNILKTNDLYPLYMYLLEMLYDSDIAELRKIFGLLVDFMLRYRIVSPAGGSGTLRSRINELIDKIDNGDVDPDFQSIYFELSNSPAATNRYPDDLEFKEQILRNLNTQYARILLLKIEEHNDRNVKVDIEKVTVEHLMPQTLNDWWKEHLGGSDLANVTHEQYLNCIGNLTILSGPLNSSVKNGSWISIGEKLGKRDVLGDECQFKITREVATQNEIWDESAIKVRNEDMANRAIEVTTSPLARKRPYRTSSNEDSYSPGIYPLSDLASPMDGSSLINLKYNEQEMSCAVWSDLVPFVSKTLYTENPILFEQIVNSNKIHKATSRRNQHGKDPILTVDKNMVIDPGKIEDSEYYCELCLSSRRARFYAQQLAELFGKLENFSIEIR